MSLMVVGILVWILLASGVFQNRNVPGASKIDFSMGTVITTNIYSKDGERIAKDVNALIRELDAEVLSWREEGSEIAVLNQALAEQRIGDVGQAGNAGAEGSSFEQTRNVGAEDNSFERVGDAGAEDNSFERVGDAGAEGNPFEQVGNKGTDIENSAQGDIAETDVVCVDVSEAVAGYIEASLKLCRDSNGALDITIHPLIDLWGIESDAPRVPEEQEIHAALSTIGYDRLSVSVGEETKVQAVSSGLSIDLGSVGKGIAADEVRSFLVEQSKDRGDRNTVKGAVVSIGGTILTYGSKPDQTPWQVGIRDPRGSQDSLIGYVSLEGTHVTSTSGDYEQYFEQNGVRYHHIFDPSTGYPADSGLMSVTIVCDNGLYSDGLSTACFILGYEDSLPLLMEYDAEAVFVTMDQKIYVTDGLANSLTVTNEEYQVVRTGRMDE